MKPMLNTAFITIIYLPKHKTLSSKTLNPKPPNPKPKPLSFAGRRREATSPARSPNILRIKSSKVITRNPKGKKEPFRQASRLGHCRSTVTTWAPDGDHGFSMLLFLRCPRSSWYARQSYLQMKVLPFRFVFVIRNASWELLTKA